MGGQHSTDADLAAAAAQLRRYGYLATEPTTHEATEDNARDHGIEPASLSAALSTYQRRHGLNVVGTLDEPTRAHLALSRCGWVDDPDAERRLRVEVRFPAAFDESADGAIVLPWFLQPIPISLPDAAGIERAIADAFAMWEVECPVQFPRRAQPTAGGVRVFFNPIDRRRGTLGQTVPGSPTQMQLDADESWSLTDPPAPQANADVLTVALHEIGHALGIGDISDSSSVMHGFFGTGQAVLRRSFTADDRREISRRFGT